MGDGCSLSSQAFRLIDDAMGSWPLAERCPPAAGLAAGLLCTVLLQPAAPAAPLSSIELWRLAGRCTIPVFAITAMAVYAAARMTDTWARRDAANAAAGIACAATWFPPVLLFFRHNSPWAAAIAAALAVAGTRALLAGRAAATGTRPIQLPATAMAAALQLSSAGMLAGDWRAAAVPLPVAAALLTWILSDSAAWPPRRSAGRRLPRVIPACMLAVTFSAGGLTPYLARGEGPGGLSGLLRALFSGAAQHGGAAEIDLSGSGGQPAVRASVAIGDVYPAVILWPDVEPYTLLVPPREALPHGLFAGSSRQEVGIPFSGFYSFRRATVLPPRRSHVTHGDPAELGFRTTDSSPLVMEAEQDFGRPIDMRCCREIALSLRIADARPGTVRLRLMLRDTRAPDRPPEAFGPEPLSDTVTFRMRPDASLREFDRAIIRFHLAGPRSDQSARIAIRRFVFIQ